MKLIINGKPTQVERASNVKELLDELGINARFIAVAINFECVPKSQYSERTLHEEDQLEILSPQQGG